MLERMQVWNGHYFLSRDSSFFLDCNPHTSISISIVSLSLSLANAAYVQCSSMFVPSGDFFLQSSNRTWAYCEVVFNIYKDETDFDYSVSVGQPAGFSLGLRLDNGHAGGREE